MNQPDRVTKPQKTEKPEQLTDTCRAYFSGFEWTLREQSLCRGTYENESGEPILRLELEENPHMFSLGLVIKKDTYPDAPSLFVTGFSVSEVLEKMKDEMRSLSQLLNQISE